MEPPHEPPAFDPSPSPPPEGPSRPAASGFELTRREFTLSDLLSTASEAWSRDLGAWVLAMLLYGLIGIGVPMTLGFLWGIVSAIQGGDGDPGTAFTWLDWIVEAAIQAVQLVLSAIFTLGMWAMALRGLHRERVSVGALFSQMSKIWKYILQAFAVGVGTVLLVAPIALIIFLAFVGPVDRSTPMSVIVENAGRPLLITLLVLAPVYVYVATGIAFLQAELAFNDDAGPIGAIVNSWRIARGKRWRIIGVGLIGALIWVGSAMLCGVGLLFGGPFVVLLTAALYLALRQGAEVPPANTLTTLGRRA